MLCRYRCEEVSRMDVTLSRGATAVHVENDAVVAERLRVESQLAGENRLLQMVASGVALSDILASLCRFVEEAAPECICGTYLIDWSVPVFKKGAAPSLPASFLEAVEGLPV